MYVFIHLFIYLDGPSLKISRAMTIPKRAPDRLTDFQRAFRECNSRDLPFRTMAPFPVKTKQRYFGVPPFLETPIYNIRYIYI